MSCYTGCVEVGSSFCSCCWFGVSMLVFSGAGQKGARKARSKNGRKTASGVKKESNHEQ